MGDGDESNNIWDIPYYTLHQILAGDLEGYKLQDISSYVRLRNNKLAACVDPFGTPSVASRKIVESGSITLDDGTTVKIPGESQEVVWALSRMLQLDEVDAFILWKTFLRNRGLPNTIETPTDDKILTHFIPFYFEERLSILRCMIALLQGRDDADSAIHAISKENLDKIIPKPRDFASTIAKQYLRRTKQPLPEPITKDPRAASKYAKQSVKEQTVLLELLFWTLSEYALHDGSLTEELYKVGYGTNLGTMQENANFLLDEEGVSILRDMGNLWTLVLVELLQIDQLIIRDCADTTADASLLISFPEYIARTQDIIFSNVTSQHGFILLAWSCLLAHLADLDITERPAYEAIVTTAKERFYQISTHILQPDFGLFKNMRSVLTSSPLFVTAVAQATGSPVTYPNSAVYRFVYKTLIMGLSQIIQIEFIPDINGLLDVWVLLFGTGEECVAARICRNYWDYDWKIMPTRRGIFDVARSRFPVQFGPLLRLLRATAGTGSFDLNSMATDEVDRKICGAYVYHYFLRLPTFTQAISVSARTGPSALYEAIIDAELYSGGVMYRNTRPIRLPGGSILPRGSSSRLLSSVTDPNDPVIVEWEHEHSGWRLLLEVLRHYVRRLDRQHNVNVEQRGTETIINLEEIGIEDLEGEQIVTDALDLVRTVIHGHPAIMNELMNDLESGPSSAPDSPDLVEVTTRILEDELSRSGRRKGAGLSRLITSAVGVLTALLSLPKYAYRVWPFLRSTSLIFGADAQSGYTSTLLAVERTTGRYEMTLSLIGLIRGLFDQAISSLLTSDPVMQPLKEVVLLRAIKFLHRELWMEHSSWKYVKLSDRFEIGRQIASLYGDILLNSSSSGDGDAFSPVVAFIMNAFLFRANTATVNPLVYAISTGDELLDTLSTTRRNSEAARTLVKLLENYTRLARLILDRKVVSSFSTKLSLLEQTLCVGIVGASLDARRSKLGPVDVLTAYVQYRLPNSSLPLESIRLLSSLCRALSTAEVSPPSIVAHLSDAEATAAAFIRIIRHPWDDLRLRNAIWRFITLTVDVQPALSSLFVRGKFHIPVDKSKAKEVTDEKTGKGGEKEKADHDPSAVKAACEALGHWEALWDANPRLLTSVLAFLEVVWRHAREHKATLEPTRTNKPFWVSLGDIGGREVGPAPIFATKKVIEYEGQTHSDCYAAVTNYAYRTRAKAYALQILALDIDFSLGGRKIDDNIPDVLSYQMIKRYFSSRDDLNDHISEAIANYYDPGCHKRLAHTIQDTYASLATPQNPDGIENQEYGDDYIFSTELVGVRLQYLDEQEADGIRHKFYTVNLNLSLADSEVALTRSWKRLLQVACPLIRSDKTSREYALGVAEAISGDIAAETRTGSPMVAIHTERLSMLLGLMEVYWFITPSQMSIKAETKLFVSLMSHIRDLITNEYFPPAIAVRSDRTTRFYRVIIQLIYFCAHKARLLGLQPKAFTADQRITIASTLTVAIRFIIEALRDIFDLARSSRDVELDKDLELLVSTFEQCTRPTLPLDPTIWLAHCQEYDVIRASLELLVHTDLTGLQDVSLLRARRHPLYARHILFFHLTLARLPSSAERLANDGVVAAYANTNLRPILSAGLVEPSIPELLGERSPTHRAWCTMLAVLTSVTGAMGPNSHFVHEEILGLIHLYGSQITQSLTWRVGDPLTLPFLEEVSHVVGLFYAIASNTNSRDNRARATLLTYAEKVSELLQDLNYALTHPNHLSSLLEPVTPEERSFLEKESRNLSVETSAQLMDPSKRPLLAAVMLKLLFIVRDLVSSLIFVSEADVVLTADSTEWPAEDALVPPITKIAPGEPASIGTLLELGSCAADILKHFSHDPLSKTDKPSLPLSIALMPFSARSAITAASQVLETVLTYAVTQLAMWVETTGQHEGGRQMDIDESGHEREGDTKRRRASMSIGGRVRKGEIAGDLKVLLTQSKPLIEKAHQQLKLDSQEMVPLLSGFLEKRLVIDT